MVANAWQDHSYTQLVGDVQLLFTMESASFDVILCHNVLEYVDDKETIVKELARVLKPGGILSVVKHNRPGRVMQMAVLLDDFAKANALLDGENSSASKFGAIRYYENTDLVQWAPELTLQEVWGLRTFWDLQQNQDKHADAAWQEQMIQLEMRVAQMSPYRDIAFFHHLLCVKSL